MLCLKQVTDQFLDSQKSVQDNYMTGYKIQGSHKGKAHKFLQNKQTKKKQSQIFPVGLPEILQQSSTVR